MLNCKLSFEEAVERISFFIDRVSMSKKDKYALTMAKNALEKQTSKKIVQIGNEKCCPACNEEICSVGDDGCYGYYCVACGQALDWGDAE